jgi:hypothetical protein
VVPAGGATVRTDRSAGTVTFQSNRPSTVLLSYGAAFGSAKVAIGVIRVDVSPRPNEPEKPVAMPDTAVLHGQQSITMDPLANDYAPSGGVLVVLRAVAVGNAAVRVGVIRGHWLRIESTSAADAGSQVVRYTISDGLSGPVDGEVAVTELPPPAVDSPPLARNDQAVVRAGDEVSVPVLDNDSDPDGDPLTLVPASVAVTGTHNRVNAGSAFVSNNTIRFAAPDPAAVTTPYEATVSYVVSDPSGLTTLGTLTVAVNPPPADKVHDQPPQPAAVDVSAISGDSVVITLLTTGVDPDGDSVTVTGLSSAPRLGRIQAIGATSITYQAFPSSGGTDTFDYQVTDPLGLTGTATIRVGVVPPGELQPPLAVADTLTAAPGTTLRVNVLANDFYASGRTSIEPLSQTNRQLPPGVSLDGDRVVIQVPGDSIHPIVVSYGITEGFSTSIAQITVNLRRGFNNPPVARDDFPPAAFGSPTVTVDVLANDDDPDGPTDALTVAAVGNPGVQVAGRKLVVPQRDLPFTASYRVTDARGGAALGLVHVPARPGAPSPPRLKPNVSPISITKDGTKTISVADYVLDPAGKRLRLTTADTLVAAPGQGLRVAAEGISKLTLTAMNGYVGPGAVTVEVTDGSSVSDPAGQRVVVSIPVQVGRVTPVLRCPTDPITLVQGGKVVSADLIQLCHVWTDSSIDPDSITFTKRWNQQAAGVDLSASGTGGRMLTLTPGNRARPGESGSITIGTQAGSASGTVAVRVVAALPPTLAAMQLNGVTAGESATVDVADYLTSPLADPQPVVTAVQQLSGMPTNAAKNGTAVTLTPGAASHGRVTFSVTVTDVSGDVDRSVAGTITLNVLGVPDAPGTPQLVSAGDEAAVLSYSTPNNNGAPIDGYVVTDDRGHSHNCPSSPCTVTGLTNGRAYVFTVRAKNIVGTSKPSGPSAAMKPDKVPEPVTSMTAGPIDRAVQVHWQQPTNGGSAITEYQVQISPDPGYGAVRRVSGSTFATTFTGLINGTSYSLRIRAVNGKGPGDFGPAVPAIPFGKPPQPAPPTATGVQDVSDHQAITVTWPQADGNGRDVSSYTVSGVGSKGQQLGPVTVTGLSTQFTVDNDSSGYTFTYTATNSGQLTSVPSATSNEVIAAGVPGPASNVTVTDHPATSTSGYDGAIHVRFTTPAPNSAQIARVEYLLDGGPSGAWNQSFAADSRQDLAVGGLTNGQRYSASVRACNDQGQCGAWTHASNGATPYGRPIRTQTYGTESGATGITWHFEARCNGRDCQCTFTDDAGHSGSAPANPTGTSSGIVTYQYANPNETHRFYLTVHSLAGAGDSVDSPFRSVAQTAPPVTPTAHIKWGPVCNNNCAVNGAGPQCGPTCRFFAFDLTNGQAGNYFVDCYTTFGGTHKFYSRLRIRNVSATGYYGSNSCFENTADPGATVWMTLYAPNGAVFDTDHRAWANAP